MGQRRRYEGLLEGDVEMPYTYSDNGAQMKAKSLR